MAKRYTKYWINEMEKPKVIFLSIEEVEKYTKQWAIGTPVLMKCVELDCKGHTYRQILGYDELDCGVKHEFLERPKIHFLRELWWDFIDFFKREKN